MEGMQSSLLALALANRFFQDPLVGVPPAISCWRMSFPILCIPLYVKGKEEKREYLRQRAKPHSSVQVKCNRMHKQANHLARKLARCWKQFFKHRRFTLSLEMAYDAVKINEECVKLMPFNELTRCNESTDILQTLQALLDRFEYLIKVFRAVTANNHPSNMDNIDHLLKSQVSCYS